MDTMSLDDGAHLAYRVDGSGAAPALVFANSLGTDLRMWDAQVEPLCRVLRIVRYDCRGHGGSDLSGEGVTIERLGRDLLALLDHLGIERAHVCGLSLGGLIAQWVAARHPERVGRVVFAHTAARIGTVESWEARIAAVRAGGMDAVREAVVARFLSTEFRARRPEVARAIGAMVAAIKPEGYIAACLALRDADLRPLTGAIRAPALIVAGALDEATPPAQSEELHAAIAASELVILANAAHLSNVEQPETFNAHLLRFLCARSVEPHPFS